MRKIIYAQLVSLDGYIEDRHGKIDWTAPGEELHRHFNELEKNLDINFYGRRMSEAMDFWLTADQNPDLKEYEREYARLWQETQRIVFSRTLDKVEGKARIERDVDPEEINKLKNQPGGDMAVGGANLASTFIKYGLVDEYRLYIHPVVLGGGKPMFPPDEKLNLEFVEIRTFPCGVVMLRYESPKKTNKKIKPMKMTKTIPALPVFNIDEAVRFYEDQLGFVGGHKDEGFAILTRDEVELHLWAACDNHWKLRSVFLFVRPVWSGAESFLAGTTSCRIEVDKIDALYQEYRKQGVLYGPGTVVEETAWGTREFAALDLHRNLLTFYEQVEEKQ